MNDTPVKRTVTWDAIDPEIRLMTAISELADSVFDGGRTKPLSPAAFERVGVWFSARCKEIAKVKGTADE